MSEPTEPTEPTDREERAAVDPPATPAPEDSGQDLAALAARAGGEVAALESEAGEIEMLVQQARTEAVRHEQKRTALADRLATLSKAQAPADEIAETSMQLVTLTRRAMLMQSQVDVLEGKLKTLGRFRDAVARQAADLSALVAAGGGTVAMPAGDASQRAHAGGGAAPGHDGTGRDPGAGPAGWPAEPGGRPGTAGLGQPAPQGGVSRVVLAAQEGLRREIARTMHDGPAQSLTNIVLQAQIVERLLERDPEAAKAEVGELVSMVQQTLDATKSFIFDVRPMVLDDLGLVPTIRRAARERGRRAQIPVDFESFGTDRRLPMELESGLFRLIDEVLAAYLEGHPARATIRLDWSDGLEARLTSTPVSTPDDADSSETAMQTAELDRGGRRGASDGASESTEATPPALVAMIGARRAAQVAASRAASGLPGATWREIQERALTLGIAVDLTDEGRSLRLNVDA